MFCLSQCRNPRESIWKLPLPCALKPPNAHWRDHCPAINLSCESTSFNSICHPLPSSAIRTALGHANRPRVAASFQETHQKKRNHGQGSKEWGLCDTNSGTDQESSIPNLCGPKAVAGWRGKHYLVTVADESWRSCFLSELWNLHGCGHRL